MRGGFTLIELAIVLVIIGLVVGGILTGQDLIRSAGERAQIAQIERYQTAVNTFYGKYAALPGDLNQQAATSFGFASRGPNAGEGDGNGVIEGVNYQTANGDRGYYQSGGETLMFWSDLTYANGLNINMIDGNFSSATSATPIPGLITGAALNNYYPQAKIGNGNYVYVMSGGANSNTPFSGPTLQDKNYFGIAAISQIGEGAFGSVTSLPALTVKQAYDIDAKIDDGLPQLGRVVAGFTSIDGIYWAVGGGLGDGAHGANRIPSNSAATGSSTTCYDSQGVSGVPQT